MQAVTNVTLSFGAAWDRLRRPIWLYDPQTGRKPYPNPAALALWAADSREEFLARDFSARSPAMKARIRRLVELTAGGATVSERWTFFPHDQPVTTQATISAFRTDAGEDLLLFEAAPEEIAAEERRSVEALRHASAMISLFDDDGRRLFANPAAYAAYGGEEGDFASRFADPAAGAEMLAGARTTAVSCLHAVTTSAGARWHHMDARPVPDPVTGRTCVLLNEQDVTDRVEAEIARSAAEQKAAMSDARQRFLTEMSHELRTPLNAVIGFSGLLADAGLDAGRTDQARRIHAAGLRLLEVVNQMIASPPHSHPRRSGRRRSDHRRHRQHAGGTGGDLFRVRDERLRGEAGQYGRTGEQGLPVGRERLAPESRPDGRFPVRVALGLLNRSRPTRVGGGCDRPTSSLPSSSAPSPAPAR